MFDLVTVKLPITLHSYRYNNFTELYHILFILLIFSFIASFQDQNKIENKIKYKPALRILDLNGVRSSAASFRFNAYTIDIYQKTENWRI